MKTFTAKTQEEALELASKEFGVPVSELTYKVHDKKVGIFNKKVAVDIYELADIVKFAEDYVLGIIDALGIESSPHTRLDDDIIRITIDSTHNPILIGKNGRTLQALNELTKLAVNNKFKKRFRVLLDINGYKQDKYEKLITIARRLAHEVQKTHTDVALDPMPADERRAIHNACGGIKNIKTESIGEGTRRQVQIIYVD